MRKIGFVVGTRPEAIKLAPVIARLGETDGYQPIVLSTGQHAEMLDQVFSVFSIEPDTDLAILRPGQSVASMTSAVLDRLPSELAGRELDAVIVQGDTTTTFAGALASFYERIPVIHVEAGLRTGDLSSPFPEELNRVLTSRIAALNLAPTPMAADNLAAEGIDREHVVVTGNTVIDALEATIANEDISDPPGLEDLLDGDRRVVLVTVHRRESWGEPMASIGRALATIAQRRRDDAIVFPIHPNPEVRSAIEPHVADLDNVRLVEPVEYGPFCLLMQRCELVLTDSGGVQEEAPSLGKPVLVLRETTERPEAVAAGTSRLVGTDHDRIVSQTLRLLDDRHEYEAMANVVNPYGDGEAAERCVAAVQRYFGEDVEVDEFSVPARGSGDRPERSATRHIT